MRKLFVSVSVSALFVLGLSEGALCAERAIQVTQPAYHSMKFYVYKPVNVPKDFYVTFDGYLVYKNAKGVWLYGSAEKGGITKTDFVVGAVIPSVVKLKPYNVKISSVAPILGSRGADTGTPPPQISDRIVYMPPASGLALYGTRELSPNNPDWTQNSNFMAIGNWHSTVDRIGVINQPLTPVAWKSDMPEVIYAWTGLQWKQIDSKGAHLTAKSMLRRELYDISKYIRRVNMLRWTEDDTHVLSQYAVMWGYKWMGLIFLSKEY